MATGCVCVNLPIRTVRVSAHPTFTSSDLFTPFSPPTAAIAEFVRPSYGKNDGNTWGTATESYGGIGPAAQRVMETGRGGAISRSHRHYGTGTLNCHAHIDYFPPSSDFTGREYNQILREPKPLIAPGVGPQKEVFPTNDAFTSHISKFAVFPSDDTNEESHNHALSSRTIAKLHSLHKAMYCRSTYQKDFGKDDSPILPIITAKVPQQTVGANLSAKDVHHHDITAMEEDGTEVVSNCNGDKEGSPCNSDGNNPSSGSDETQVTEGSQTEVEDQTENNTPAVVIDNRLHKGHVTITRLSELPEHFRRITSRYTRNCTTPWPCGVSYCMLSKHSLLPSSIAASSSTALAPELLFPNQQRPPSSGSSSTDSEERPASSPSSATTKHSRAETTGTGTAATSCTSDEVGRANGSFWKHDGIVISSRGQHDFPAAAAANLRGGSGFVRRRGMDNCKTVGGDDGFKLPSIPLEKLDSPHASSFPGLMPHTAGTRVPHRLGLRYKSEAHSRFHRLYPECAPDLRDWERKEKKYYVSGYHTSVFRG